MNSSASQKRLAENEMIFRQHNERIRAGLEKLVKEIKKEEQDLLGNNLDLPLHFYCECSDENCRKRIIITPTEYKKLHKNSSQFIVLPGHQVASIERKVNEESNFVVVEKFVTPPKNPKRLNKTDIDNT